MAGNVDYLSDIAYTSQCLSQGGIFLTAGPHKPNTMTIGWGGINYYWGKPLFVVPVRYSRYTYPLLNEAGEFTVSVPAPGSDLKRALGIMGTKSGRDIDKYAAAGLTLAPGRALSTPVIAECGLHYECRVVMKQTMDPAGVLEASILEKDYTAGNFHTLFYGKIVACYHS
nr:flavin reductase family protein [bacterium]